MAKREGAEPDVFMKKLVGGRLGETPMKGTTFFLYSGDQDENWGLKMSQRMANAKRHIEKNVRAFIEKTS